MAARTGEPLSVVARPQACNLAATNLATLAKPVLAPSVMVRTSEISQFVSSDRLEIDPDLPANSLVHSKDSPPNLPATSISSVVLRV